MITLTGGLFQNSSNNPVALGSMVFELNMDAQVIAPPYGFVTSEIPIIFQFDKFGNIQAGAQLWSNLELSPAIVDGLATLYFVTIYNANGERLNSIPMWWQFIEPNGSTVDISTMTAVLEGIGIGDTSVALTPAFLEATQTFTGTDIFTGPVEMASLIVGSPAGGNEGPGTINVSGGYFVNGVAIGTPGVTSVFGRIGAVVATIGDYNVGQITGAAPSASPTFTGIVLAQDIEGVQYADQFPGGDMGAKINNAMAALPAAGGTVYVPAGSYTFATTITMIKNCQIIGAGSCATILTYTGTSDAILLSGTVGSWGAQAPYMNGLLRGFTVTGLGNANAGIHGVHHVDCIGTTYDDLVISFFQTSNAAGIYFENHILFSERVSLRKVSIYLNSFGILMANTGGDPSFGYHRWEEVHFQIGAFQYGIFLIGTGVAGSVFFYNGFLGMDANIGATTGTLIALNNGADISAMQFSVNAEFTGVGSATGIFVDATSVFNGDGHLILNQLPNSIFGLYEFCPISINPPTATTATAGGVQAVPATVLGYIETYVGTTLVKVPYFSA